MNKNGAVLFVTVVVLCIVVIMAAGISIMSGRDIYTVRRLRTSTQAYFLAEAGIEESICDLRDNNFDLDNFPKDKELGGGSFTVTLDTTNYSSADIVKVVSTGTVGDVTRTMSVTVKNSRIQAFSYAGLINNYAVIYPGCNIDGNFHSNSPSQAIALLIVGLPGARSIIDGNATARGRVTVGPYSTVTGIAAGNQPAVSLPPFDASFWDYYYQLARRSGNVYTGLKRIRSNLNPANGVIWVNGPAWLEGTFNFTGTIIATGNILINAYSRGTVTVTPKAGFDNFPALMSKNSFIWAYDTTTINGLFYAGSYMVLSDVSPPLNVTVNGVLITGSFLQMYTTNINYAEVNPPGLNSPGPFEVLNWGS